MFGPCSRNSMLRDGTDASSLRAKITRKGEYEILDDQNKNALSSTKLVNLPVATTTPTANPDDARIHQVPFHASWPRNPTSLTRGHIIATPHFILMTQNRVD